MVCILFNRRDQFETASFIAESFLILRSTVSTSLQSRAPSIYLFQVVQLDYDLRSLAVCHLLQQLHVLDFRRLLSSLCPSIAIGIIRIVHEIVVLVIFAVEIKLLQSIFGSC